MLLRSRGLLLWCSLWTDNLIVLYFGPRPKQWCHSSLFSPGLWKTEALEQQFSCVCNFTVDLPIKTQSCLNISIITIFFLHRSQGAMTNLFSWGLQDIFQLLGMTSPLKPEYFAFYTFLILWLCLTLLELLRADIHANVRPRQTRFVGVIGSCLSYFYLLLYTCNTQDISVCLPLPPFLSIQSPLWQQILTMLSVVADLTFVPELLLQ